MDYNGLNAKIHAMRGRMLKYSDYEILSKMIGVEEIGLWLRGSPGYSKAMAQADGVELRRGIIERNLNISLYDEFIKIYTFINDYNIREYIDALFLNYEIDILKTLLGALFEESEPVYSPIGRSLVYGESRHMDVAKLSASGTVAELIENLKGSIFYNVLNNMRTGGIKLFDIEMQLDLFYYVNLWKAQKKHLDSENRKIMAKIKGTEADLLNIMWIYSFKAYYGLESKQLYAYLIPVRYNLAPECVNAMVESKSLDELKREISATAYGESFSGAARLEDAFYHEMNKVYKNAVLTRPNSIALTAAQIYYKELEIKNIISLVEGVRYGLGSAKALRHLHFA